MSFETATELHSHGGLVTTTFQAMNSCQSSSLCGFVVKNLVDVCHKQRLCFQFEDLSAEVQLRDAFGSLWPCGRMAGFQGSYWVWPCPCTSLNFVEQVLDVHLEAWVGFWNFKKLETYQSQIRSFQAKGTFCPNNFPTASLARGWDWIQQTKTQRRSRHQKLAPSCCFRKAWMWCFCTVDKLDLWIARHFEPMNSMMACCV